MNDLLDVETEATELAIKAHVLWSSPDIRSEMPNKISIPNDLLDAIDLTEAPEDALCTLVMDLLRYCDKEKIDWPNDVMARARKRLRARSGQSVRTRTQTPRRKSE